jgi:hypothetical protein
MLGWLSRPAADEDLEPKRAVLVQVHSKADVVHCHCGTIVRRARDGDLEFSGQIRKLRMQHRILAQQFAVHARIGKLILSATGVLIRRNIANAISG